MGLRLLINDGYTLPGAIPERWPWPAVKFSYRPALPESVYEFLEAPKANGAQRLASVVKLLTKHMVSWDVTDDKDALVPITEANLKRVPQPVLDQLLNFVTGYGQPEQEADAKNSAGG